MKKVVKSKSAEPIAEIDIAVQKELSTLIKWFENDLQKSPDKEALIGIKKQELSDMFEVENPKNFTLTERISYKYAFREHYKKYILKGERKIPYDDNEKKMVVLAEANYKFWKWLTQKSESKTVTNPHPFEDVPDRILTNIVQLAKIKKAEIWAIDNNYFSDKKWGKSLDTLSAFIQILISEKIISTSIKRKELMRFFAKRYNSDDFADQFRLSRIVKKNINSEFKFLISNLKSQN